MTLQQAYRLFENSKRSNTLILGGILFLIFATTGVDYLYSEFQHSSFVLSESLIFSSAYWLLFYPLINILWKAVNWSQSVLFGLFMTVSTIIIHLLCYPALVWLLSMVFYEHTFHYVQTIDFGLTAYAIKTFIIYGLAFLFFINKRGRLSSYPTLGVEEKKMEPSFISSVIVSVSNNNKILISTHDIMYILANSPYVTICHQSKKYLHNEALKTLERKLDTKQFIRIHKSCIVNIDKIVSYKSRLNGDYDLTLVDGAVLRVSRNYAATFKERFLNTHRLTAK
jgi:hypothetical protein